MRVAFLACSALASKCALGGDFIYQEFNPPTVFNSGVEVITEVNNSSGFVQGPQNSTGTINANFTDNFSVDKSVSSSASIGIGSVTADATIFMNANLTGESISGKGTLTGNAMLSGGPLAGATALTDGSADFDIFFTLNHPQQVSLDFTASTTNSLVQPNNLAVVFLQGPTFNTLLRAESTGTGSQNAMSSVVLAPGDYFLRGAASVDDIVTTDNNGPSLYGSKESFAFSLQATSALEPATLGLMVLGLLGAGFAGRKRRS